MRIQALPKHPKSASELLCAWLLLLVAAAVALGATSASADQSELPPLPERWVTDSAGFLSAPAQKALDDKLAAYERQSGHQIVVWIGKTSGSLPLDEFATKTFEKWKLGQKKLDDGLLIAVLATDRKIAIEVGYGLEARVPDAIASRIINDVMVPKLRAGDADGAVASGVDAVLTAIDGGKAPPASETAPQPPKFHPSIGQIILFGLLALGFLLLLVTHPSLALSLLYVLGSGGGGRGGGGGGGGFSGGGGRSGGGGARGSW